MNQLSEITYERLNSELDLLIDEQSEFRYFAKKKRRILVDKSEPKIPATKIRSKNEGRYIELAVVTYNSGVFKEQSLGRYILSISDHSKQVDHRNNNTLDNRRKNLREVSRHTNQLNRKRYNFNNTYKGVYKLKQGWLVEIWSHKLVHRLFLPLTSTNEIEAAIIYDHIAIKLNGPDHVTNFDINYSETDIYSTIEKWWSKVSIIDRNK